MILGDPPETGYDLHFAVFDIPVRVHPFFWLVAVLLGANNVLVGVLTWVVAMFLAVLAHELGHALAMRWYGFDPQVMLYGLGGLTSYGRRIRMGAPRLSTGGRILISFAGPAAGFTLAGLLALGFAIAGYGIVYQVGLPFGLTLAVRGLTSDWASLFIHQFLFVNIVWGLLNLMPILPLDGGQIAREILVATDPWHGARKAVVLSIVTGVALCVMGIFHGSIVMAILFGYLAFMNYMQAR